MLKIDETGQQQVLISRGRVERREMYPFEVIDSIVTYRIYWWLLLFRRNWHRLKRSYREFVSNIRVGSEVTFLHNRYNTIKEYNKRE